jgi:hypothetical protein
VKFYSQLSLTIVSGGKFLLSRMLISKLLYSYFRSELLLHVFTFHTQLLRERTNMLSHDDFRV